MNRLQVILLTLMPVLAVADITTLADCLPGGVNNGYTGGTAANFATWKTMGEMAFVVRDPTSQEAGLTCFVLNLMPNNNYTLRYKDASGVVQRVNGSYTDQRTTTFIINNQDAYAALQGLPPGVLNNGALFPQVFAQDQIILQTCRQDFINGIRSTYVVVPLATAKANPSNAGCGCDNWSTA